MRIGIDLGGTKTEVIALDDAGEQRFRHRLPTPREDYQQTIETIATLVDMAEQATGQTGSVGIGIPGSLSPYTGVVKNANSTWLNGQPFDSDVSRRLKREVRLANDANCLAVSEAVDGAAAGAQTVFAVIIGTGCGAGVALNGRVHIGGNGTAGEWGHNPLPWMDDDELRYREEIPCYCGKQGCIETFISGTGFATDYQRLSGNALKGDEIIRLVDAQDAVAELALSRYELRLAKALSHVVNILDPDVIVLGGGMSNVERLYKTVPSLMKSFVFGGECETPVRKARHGDSSGVRAAPSSSPPLAFCSSRICSGAESANRPAQQINAKVSDAVLYPLKKKSAMRESTITRSVTTAMRSGVYLPESLPLNRLPNTIPSPTSIIINVMLVSEKPEMYIINGLI